MRFSPQTFPSARKPTWCATTTISSGATEGQHCVARSLLFRRQVVEKIGGLTSFMEGAEDYEFVARAIVQGFNVQNLRSVLYYYREHEGQRSREFYGVRAALGNVAEGTQ